ncbi:hypothetical protein [Streptomyces sp. AC512_CC834]|uniref:hypothetical protein n=1 Tax=Streptomyces sp. AC512_CC834 TaxID=2823691 RepID=UPI001C25589B|nr:hypothetical protein [Streptomyces sp. AC512_CC834]
MSGSREKIAISVDDMPIDVDGAGDTVDSVLGMRLDASRRQDIDSRTGVLIGFMSELLTADLGANDDDEVMALYRACYHLLDLKRRPTQETPVYESFQFMRDCAIRARALLALYEVKNGAKAP